MCAYITLSVSARVYDHDISELCKGLCHITMGSDREGQTRESLSPHVLRFSPVSTTQARAPPLGVCLPHRCISLP